MKKLLSRPVLSVLAAVTIIGGLTPVVLAGTRVSTDSKVIMEEIVSVKQTTLNGTTYVSGVVTSGVTTLRLTLPTGNTIEIKPLEDLTFTVSFAAPKSTAYVSVAAYADSTLLEIEKVKVDGTSTSTVDDDDQDDNDNDDQDDTDDHDNEDTSDDEVKVTFPDVQVTANASFTPNLKAVQLNGVIQALKGKSNLKNITVYAVAPDGQKVEIKLDKNAAFNLQLHYQNRSFSAKNIRLDVYEDGKLIGQSYINYANKLGKEMGEHLEKLDEKINKGQQKKWEKQWKKSNGKAKGLQKQDDDRDDEDEDDDDNDRD